MARAVRLAAINKKWRLNRQNLGFFHECSAFTNFGKKLGSKKAFEALLSAEETMNNYQLLPKNKLCKHDSIPGHIL